MSSQPKICVLDDTKVCDECGDCNRCDLDPNNICDNCMKCVKSDAEYNAVEIDEIIESEKLPAEYDDYEMPIYAREKKDQ